MTDFPFAVEAEIVRRAAGLPGAIAADLAVFGGILRCGECGGERPLDDVAGYLRGGWPAHCGKTMSWVTLKLLAAEGRDVPGGYELVAVPDGDWQVDGSRRCRRQGARHKVCGKPSVASLQRGNGPWGYCIDHLYGRWIESGSVMVWILRERNVSD
jgi:hypothetical protein